MKNHKRKSLKNLSLNLAVSTVLVAVLAVIGYSLNDTIAIFDRIRENFRKMRKGTPVEVVNVNWRGILTPYWRLKLTPPC